MEMRGHLYSECRCIRRPSSPNIPLIYHGYSLPKTKVPNDTNLEAVVKSVLKTFPGLGEEHSITDDALWRDTYALTGTIRTSNFGASVTTEWASLTRSHGVPSVTLVLGSAKVIRVSSVLIARSFT